MGDIPGKGDADCLPRESAQTHRLQDVAGLHLARATGSAGADGDFFQVEGDHLHTGRGAGQGDAGCVRQAASWIAADHRTACQCGGFRQVSQGGESDWIVGLAGSDGCREAGDQCDRRGAASPAAFLTTATDQWRLERSVRGEQQRTDAGRPAKLVRGNRQAMGTEQIEADLHASSGLNSVHMQQGTMSAADGGGLFHRLDDAGFVVRQHQTDQ